MTPSGGKKRDSTTTTTHTTQMQEPCTFSFVGTRHDSLPSSSFSASSSDSSSISLFSGLWLGLAFAFTSGYGSMGIDWVLLGSLVFQFFFFWTVVWRELPGFARRQLNNIFRNWVWAWTWNWHRKLHWARVRHWNWNSKSVALPWNLGDTASSFRRLG